MSGLTRPAARVKGLGLGADDFITKPFDRAELLARIQTVIQRSNGRSPSSVDIGPLQIRLESREVTVVGRVLPLTGKEYSILEVLVSRKGMALTKAMILNQLYSGKDEPEMKIIDVFVCKLRKKLAQTGVHNMITTPWGRGYAIYEPVTVRHDELPRIPSRKASRRGSKGINCRRPDPC